jgi:alkaline phosphatase D
MRNEASLLESLLIGSAKVIGDKKRPANQDLSENTDSSHISPNSLPIFHPKYEIGKGFPQSVASGDPTPTGAILWTRIDPALSPGIGENQFEPQLIQWLDGSFSPNSTVINAIHDGKFAMVEVATDFVFEKLAFRGYTPIWKNLDNIVKVDLDGYLQPLSTYYYRFVTKDGYVSKTGRFKTLPPKDTHIDSLKFAYISCQDYTNGYYHSLGYIAEEELDFVVHLGDYIYESVRDCRFQNPLPDREIQLPSGKEKASTIEDYRTIYQTTKSDPNLQKLHENHAVVSIWDDHEFANDSYSNVAPDDEDKKTIPNDKRRLIANQVWFEYTPARVLLDTTKESKDSIKIYRSFQVGNLAEIILTDERLYRSPHPCGENTLFERYFSPDCPAIHDPTRSMLGTAQCKWFLKTIKNSNAVWKIWANEVQFTPLKALGRYLNLDAWDGYSSERKLITEEIKNAGIKNFISITGDMHSFEANLILVDYDKDRHEDAIGVELMGGSITSANLEGLVKKIFSPKARVSCISHPVPIDAVEQILSHPKFKIQLYIRLALDTIPIFFRFVREIDFKKVTPKFLQWALYDHSRAKLQSLLKEIRTELLTKLIYSENPWIKFFNSETHGYCVMELTHQKATWTAYYVKDIKVKESKRKSRLCKCEIPRNKAEIIFS